MPTAIQIEKFFIIYPNSAEDAKIKIYKTLALGDFCRLNL